MQSLYTRVSPIDAKPLAKYSALDGRLSDEKTKSGVQQTAAAVVVISCFGVRCARFCDFP